MSEAAAAPVLRRLGRVDYAETWRAMRAFTQARDAATADEIWLVEHDPVFTLGQAGRSQHLHDPGDIPVVATDRGGQVTYHGPGQVVAYVLVDMRRQGIFVKELVHRVEQAVIQVLTGLGVDGRRVRGAPGVYVPFADGTTRASASGFDGLGKIAALGVKVTRGCSYHGVALNGTMDLAPFSRIDPCGYAGLRTIDLATLGVERSWSALADALGERLAAHFTRHPVAA